MNSTKYSKMLTGILIAVIILIVGILGYVGIDMYQRYFINKSAKEAVSQFENQTVEEKAPETKDENYIEVGEVGEFESTPNTGGTEKSSNKQYYQGYEMAGTIKIPKTGVEYPILADVTRNSLEVAVVLTYTENGVNEPGNTIISGHNYRNGVFFSNNKKLANGDKIYIRDLTGRQISYTIYHKYETAVEDVRYMTRDTEGRREISLSTCTDSDANKRLIIWAKED